MAAENFAPQGSDYESYHGGQRNVYERSQGAELRGRTADDGLSFAIAGAGQRRAGSGFIDEWRTKFGGVGGSRCTVLDVGDASE